MLASTLLDQVGTMLNDMETGFEHVRWPVPELLRYITEATAAIAQGKPALFVTIDAINLAPGSLQRLPDQYIRLLNVHHNINRDGTEGATVMPSVHEMMQAFDKPSCVSTGVPTGVIQSFELMSESSRFFSVDPAIPYGLSYTPQVSASVLMSPQEVTSAAQPLFFPSSNPQMFQGALVDWMLYRCYSKDQESTTSLERAKLHLLSFQSYLGVGAMQPQAAAKRSTSAKASA